ncbi:uncharacterized protein N7483_003455 [Penicillium malachiteum]|uniref:uncharacterized protein n=1 Tax=Penicillium malachiteum TaxID=1324776 RepID=UPI002546A9FA|nr:uncharacterized protein N7483_003455 [Penicillium malachiteum]KAJ5728947.1 hypothetical protein N7483_003455 [Penicillium malachiteum]
MADPLSMAASIVGVVGPALHSIRLLARDLEQIKDAPKSIAALRERINSVARALVTLEKIDDQEWEALGVSDDAKSTIEKCGDSCKAFSEEIKRWTRHSQGNSLTLLDRSKIGFWKQHQITSMEKELQYCQSTITQVVSIATLSLRNNGLSQPIRDEKERQVTSSIQVTTAEVAELAVRKKEIRMRGAAVDDDDKDELAEYEFASSQVSQEQKSLAKSQKLLEVLLAKIQEPNISQLATKMHQDQSVHVTFGGNNHGIQMGVNNAPMNNLTFGAGANHYYH